MDNQSTKSYPNIAQSWGITGILILGMLLLLPVNLVLNNFIGKEASMFIYYLLSVGIPFIIVNAARKRRTGRDTFNLAIGNKKVIPFIIIGTIALLFGVSSPMMSLIPVPEFFEEAFKELANQRGIFAFMTIAIAAPVLEEMIFRGIVLDGLLKRYSLLKSILLSSFLFGLVHLNPWQFISGMVVGIFAGWIYYRTKSLSLAILVHASNNLSAFLAGYFIDSESSMNDSLSEMYGGWINAMMVILGAVIIAMLCIYFLKKEFDKSSEEDQLCAEGIEVPIDK